MAIVLDHTIVPVKDQAETVAFYVKIFGFKDEGRLWHFAIVRVNETLTFDFIAAKKFPTQHFAFAMEAEEFERVFQRIKEAGIAYGDGPSDLTNMKDHGMTQGARGKGKAVYFRDPSGHVLEIKTY